MKTVTVQLRFPIKGLALGHAYSDQPLDTTPACKNVRAFDVEQDAARGGQRPGTEKWHAAQVQGTTNPVQDLNALAQQT